MVYCRLVGDHIRTRYVTNTDTDGFWLLSDTQTSYRYAR